MKKILSVLTLLVVFSLTACSQEVPPAAASGSAGGAEVESGAVWPENEYTKGLPVPPGTIRWAVVDAEHGNCCVSLTDISEAEYEEYMELLEQEGFSVVEEVSEEIKGQDYASTGALLSNGEKGLSVSYIPNSFGIYISFIE